VDDKATSRTGGKKLMNNIETIKKFLKDESGQTTTEYILILAVIVTIFMQFRKRLLTIIQKLFKGLDTATDTAMSDMSSDGGN
jgi:Flp pilus assembly pilin Flp